MKLTVQQDTLHKALSLAGRAVHGRSTLPVLGNIALSAEGGQLRVAATNLEVGINTWIDADIDEVGGITLPAKLLTELVSSLPDAPVEIVLESRTQTARITCRGVKASIKGVAIDEFPIVGRTFDIDAIELPAATLRTMIAKTVFAAATDESRPTLTGVETKLVDGRFTMAATDGYRLSVMSANVDTDATIATVIPAKSLSILERMLDKADTVTVHLDENQAQFSTQSAQLVTSLIAAKFPNYNAIIPKRSTVTATVNTAALTNAVRTAGLFARDNSNIVWLCVSADDMTVTATSDESGNSSNTLDAKTTGLNDILTLDIAFNARYLLDLLAQVDEDNVTFQFTQPNRPGMVQAGDWLAVVMPMHPPR